MFYSVLSSLYPDFLPIGFTLSYALSHTLCITLYPMSLLLFCQILPFLTLSLTILLLFESCIYETTL